MQESMLIVLSGPSGVGKDSICDAYRAMDPKAVVSVSVTTRQPRPGETHGVHYFFHNRDEFVRMREQNCFLEWAEIYGDCYGTLRSHVQDQS